MKNVLFLMILFISVVSYSQTKSIKNTPLLSETKAINVGMSDERLKRIDLMLKLAIDSAEIPGAVALVSRKGKVVYYKAFGYSDNETNKLMQIDNIFRIASQTKAITATALMMLWEEGKFELDDPISKYIPEFKNAVIFDSLIEADSSFISKPAKNEITVRNLLTHTSGIGYGIIDDSQFRKIYQKAGIIDAFTIRNVTLKENIEKLAELPLHHEPGEQFTYSEGLDVIAYLIEKISGMPFDKLLKERIFDPLEMNDTYFYLPVSEKERLVTVQTKIDGKWVKYYSKYYDVDYPIKGAMTYFSGGAGLSSSAIDYANFLQMYLNMGEVNGIRLLSRKTIQFMLKNQIGDIYPDPNYNLSLAFQVTNQKGEAIGGNGSAGTFSWGGYFNTIFFADPEEQIIGILMKQTLNIPSDNTNWKFRVLVEQAIDD